MSEGPPRPLRPIVNADPRANFAPYVDEVRGAFERVLASGRFVLGPEVEAFEGEFAAWLGAAHVVTVANGTDALELALRAVGVAPGAGVIVPANTVSATAAAVVAAGARPVFVDVDPDTANLAPAAVAAVLASPQGAGVRAIVPVHLYGHPCDMAALAALARRHDLAMVEDCAQAHGAAWDGRPCGTWGDAAAFSFYPTKNLAALGDGGAVVTADRALADRVRAWRQYGWRERYVSFGEGGRNSRLDEVQAAILRVRLRYLDAENARRRSHARRYRAALAEAVANAALVLPPDEDERARAVFHQFAVRVERRDEALPWLQERGVWAQALYPVPLHRQPAFAPWARAGEGAMPVTEQWCAQTLCLPVHAALAEREVDTVAALVLEWCWHSTVSPRS
jgi:aminotransferase EvaB